MTRYVSIIGFLAVGAVALGLLSATAGAGDATPLQSLARQIQSQTAATRAAMALVEHIWVPRIAGLGVGLAVGLTGGGVVAYATRGGGS